MTDFSERLDEHLIENNISCKDLAKSINISIRTVYDWRAGNQEILLHNLIALCNYLNCSIDFLSGRRDSDYKYTPQSIPPFMDALINVMKENNINKARLSKDTRFTSSYFARWQKGAEPNLSTLIELANYFNCSIDYLIGREKNLI